jgi:sugar phosphate isomerase/epimerase
LIDAASSAGVARLGLQRRPVEEFGVARAAALVRRAGLTITSYAGGGYWATDGPHVSLSDNLRFLDDAAELGTNVVGVQAGGIRSGDRRLPRARVAEGLRELALYAAERNIKLAIEPVHPMFCPDVSVLATMRQALDWIDAVDHPAVGMLVDVSHVAWDPELTFQLR